MCWKHLQTLILNVQDDCLLYRPQNLLLLLFLDSSLSGVHMEETALHFRLLKKKFSSKHFK